jgi:uncharacterized protein (TIGR02996 family)
MSDHQALLQSILDQPEDETRRLIYADWLEEHGDPDRASFVRVQCALAEQTPDDERWPALPNFARLRRLGLYNNAVSDGAVQKLKASPHLPRLHEVRRTGVFYLSGLLEKEMCDLFVPLLGDTKRP